MNLTEKQILLGQALKTQVDAAAKLVQELFLDPLKATLLELPALQRREGLVVRGVKAYIQETKPKDDLDVEKIEADFKAAVESGGIPESELGALLKSGALGIADSKAAAALLVARELGSGYTKRIAGGKNPALRLITQDEAQFAGLQDLLRETVDLEGAIRKAAMSPVPTPAIPAGRVVLQKK